MPILLERILLNLVSNAVRYTRTGGVVVGCRRDGDKLRIDVCDSGIGIAADQQRNIFNEFYQVVARTRREAGTGWGWASRSSSAWALCWITRSASSSIVGKGSRFSVTVPTVRPVRRSSCAPCRHQVAGRSAARQVVVVIDDDVLVLDAMRRPAGAAGVAACSPPSPLRRR